MIPTSIPLHSIVIYQGLPWYASSYKMDPNFTNIRRLFGSSDETIHNSHLTPTYLTRSDMYILNIASDSQFIDQFPELFV